MGDAERNCSRKALRAETGRAMCHGPCQKKENEMKRDLKSYIEENFSETETFRDVTEDQWRFITVKFTPKSNLTNKLRERLQRGVVQFPSVQKLRPQEHPYMEKQDWGAYLDSTKPWQEDNSYPQGFAVFQASPKGDITIPGICVVPASDPACLMGLDDSDDFLNCRIIVGGTPGSDKADSAAAIRILRQDVLEFLFDSYIQCGAGEGIKPTGKMEQFLSRSAFKWQV
jgi:hypothetical protein